MMQWFISFLLKRNVFYIGITNNIERRLKQHKKDKEWFEDVTKIKTTNFMQRNEAHIYEIYYINKIKPRYNIEFNNIKTEFSITIPEIDFMEYSTDSENNYYIYNFNEKQDYVNLRCDKEKWIKLYITDLPHEKNLRTSSFGFLFRMAKYLDMETNMIRDNKNKSMSDEQISIIIGKCKTTLSSILKDLKDNNVIKIEGNTHNRKIYVNPYVMSFEGRKVRHIVNMFEVS